jgi:hypothetical protein
MYCAVILRDSVDVLNKVGVWEKWIGFLVDILKSHANQCFDSFSEDLQDMLKVLDRL